MQKGVDRDRLVNTAVRSSGEPVRAQGRLFVLAPTGHKRGQGADEQPRTARQVSHVGFELVGQVRRDADERDAVCVGRCAFPQDERGVHRVSALGNLRDLVWRESRQIHRPKGFEHHRDASVVVRIPALFAVHVRVAKPKRHGVHEAEGVHDQVMGAERVPPAVEEVTNLKASVDESKCDRAHGVSGRNASRTVKMLPPRRHRS